MLGSSLFQREGGGGGEERGGGEGGIDKCIVVVWVNSLKTDIMIELYSACLTSII